MDIRPVGTEYSVTFPPKNVGKYYWAKQATDDNTAHAHCMLDD